jgi:pimeloyl-ACP methyl ester carboxylesterase
MRDDTQSGTLMLPSGRIAYTLWGSGLPVVRPPAWSSHQGLLRRQPEERRFARVFSTLSPPWREITDDRRGTGLSIGGNADLSFESQVEDLEYVVDSLTLDRFALLCHSAATLLGVTYITRHPERVSHLICVNGSARGQRFNIQQLVSAIDALLMLDTGWDIGFEVLTQLLYPKMNGTTSLGLRRALGPCGRAHAARSMDRNSREGCLKPASAINCPHARDSPTGRPSRAAGCGG